MLLSFSVDEYFDTVVNLDVPIVLGAPFDFQVSAGITATSGHGYDDLIPFEGHAGGNFAARLGLSGASVLDANGTVIPGAAISASESGTVYAPEPSAVASSAAALGVMGALARRARRTSRSDRPARCHRRGARGSSPRRGDAIRAVQGARCGGGPIDLRWRVVRADWSRRFRPRSRQQREHHQDSGDPPRHRSVSPQPDNDSQRGEAHVPSAVAPGSRTLRRSAVVSMQPHASTSSASRPAEIAFCAERSRLLPSQIAKAISDGTPGWKPTHPACSAASGRWKTSVHAPFA